MSIVTILKEARAGEMRVAASPDVVEKLVQRGMAVRVESGAGSSAGFDDDAYLSVGATVGDLKAVLTGAAVVLKVDPPGVRPDGTDEIALMARGTISISFIFPKRAEALVKRMAQAGITAFAMDAVPRTTRAQKMDALSSMANIAGYRAVVEAAWAYQSFFSGQFTAAGRVRPATVLIIGAGVAGLAAIGAARGLGAVVRAFDTREAARDEVKSLGAEFLELNFEESGEGGGGYAKVMSQAFIDAEMALFREQAPEVDVVITTALVPGARAPKLWDQQTVELMKPGSIVVDLAAAQGGNCSLTKAGEIVDHGGVKILGYSDLPSRMPGTSSRLYGTNLRHFLEELTDDTGDIATNQPDLSDPLIRGPLITHGGEVTWPPPKVEAKKPSRAKHPVPRAPQAQPKTSQKASAAAAKAVAATPPPADRSKNWIAAVIGMALAGAWLFLRYTAPTGPLADAESAGTHAFLEHLTVFVLACFVGWQVVWNVTAALHTPLMSVTNAISGIIIVGGLLEGGRGSGFDLEPAVILALVATFLATINIVGGFWVSHRMLKMFRKGG